MRYKIILSYDGSGFYGFQRQTNLRTVQGELEKSLTWIFKEPIIIYGAGRTDKSVHALMQVVHFDSETVIKETDLFKALSSTLPDDISISKVEHTNQNFHARFSAVSKTYKYYISFTKPNPFQTKYCYFYPYKINKNLLKKASKLFLGEHDFKSFCKSDVTSTTIRTIDKINVSFRFNKMIITISGQSFLHNQVRMIVAMLFEVARGKITQQELKNLIDCKITMPIKVFPGNGLYLTKISY